MGVDCVRRVAAAGAGDHMSDFANKTDAELRENLQASRQTITEQFCTKVYVGFIVATKAARCYSDRVDALDSCWSS